MSHHSQHSQKEEEEESPEMMKVGKEYNPALMEALQRELFKANQKILDLTEEVGFLKVRTNSSNVPPPKSSSHSPVHDKTPPTKPQTQEYPYPPKKEYASASKPTYEYPYAPRLRRHEEEGEYESGWRPRDDSYHYYQGRVDSNLNSIKMKIPPFKGRNSPDDYLEWEKKVEHIFDLHNYSEEKKVKLAIVELSDYALVWWDQVVTSRRRNREHPISTWDEMKALMRK